MKTNSRFLFAAGIALAMAFTFGCFDNNDDDDPSSPSSPSGSEQSYSYCITAVGCLEGPFTTNTCNGQLSNNCPNGGNGSSSSVTGGSSFSDGGGSSFTYNGKTYSIVKIGYQTWMAENLNYNVSGSKCYGEDGQDLNGYTQVYTTLSPAEIEANCTKYGRLYDWATAMALPDNCNNNSCSSQISAKHRGICPNDWHIPNNVEWDALMTAVGGSSTAGTKLKTTSGWSDGGNGTDFYGFSALPGGYGKYNGTFSRIGTDGAWWSSSDEVSDDSLWEIAYILYLNQYEDAATKDIDGKSYLHSIRCIKDD
jgi:uncharacterized protein (TIGR02145 family)